LNKIVEASDDEYNTLEKTIMDGFPDRKCELPETIRKYTTWRSTKM